SADGVDWRQETPHAGWSPRLAGGLVEFADKLWILGGTENYYFGDESSLRNDVWCSDNGRDWTRVCEHAPWAPRAYHQAVVLKGRMYVLGGGNYVPKYQAMNDVWSSADGVNWRQETAAAEWSPRLWFSAVPYRDRLWVVGGWSNQPSRNWGDCWYSRDGIEWKEWKSEPTWKERHEHSAYVFRDRLWIAGGHAQPLSSEVWSLEISPQELP
ncbi:MAG: galactose oxidase, partial [Planctomycetaceae bacterium]